MRTVSVLAPALLVACVACTYGIPDLALDAGGAGLQAGDASPTVDGTTGDDSSGGAGDDADTDGGGSHSEGGATTDGPCSGSLCPCNNATDCASRVCAVELTVGQDLFTAAGNANFCTKPCCTSKDCDPGSVCFASGQGGNYCVDPKWVGRVAPGSGIGGAQCSSGSTCRSGLCLGSGLCADTCCSYSGSSAECTGGSSQCAFGAFQGVGFDTHFTGRCGPPGGASPYGANCGSNSDCAGGLCFNEGGGGNCTHPCATSAECGSGNACQLDIEGTDIYAACFPWNASGPEGSSCTNDDQCLGDWCGTTNQCSNICFTDAVCAAAVSSWHCTPQEDQLPNGTYNVLACGP
jgi:hypothetical protein